MGKRINNKLFSDDRKDPEIGQYCTHILILYSVVVFDQITAAEVEHIAEVQLILHDFYVLDGTQHKIYEVERTDNPEDLAGHPIFPIIRMDESEARQSKSRFLSMRHTKKKFADSRSHGELGSDSVVQRLKHIGQKVKTRK